MVIKCQLRKLKLNVAQPTQKIPKKKKDSCKKYGVSFLGVTVTNFLFFFLKYSQY